MPKSKTQKELKKEFGEFWNTTPNAHLNKKIVWNWIDQALKQRDEDLIKKIEQIVRANHMRSDVGYGLGLRKLILLEDLFDILDTLKQNEN